MTVVLTRSLVYIYTFFKYGDYVNLPTLENIIILSAIIYPLELLLNVLIYIQLGLNKEPEIEVEPIDEERKRTGI